MGSTYILKIIPRSVTNANMNTSIKISHIRGGIINFPRDEVEDKGKRRNTKEVTRELDFPISREGVNAGISSWFIELISNIVSEDFCF